VVEYRTQIYIPRIVELEKRCWYLDQVTGEFVPPRVPLPSRRVIKWWHDESIFYAHDRRKSGWYHKDCDHPPQKKGEGVSFMVADFFSADFGWLEGQNGETARVTLKPGKNREGYFEGDDVRNQALKAAQLVRERWPEFEHVFIYDNATTHRKRNETALSAIDMPKFPSGVRGKKESNFGCMVTQRDESGKSLGKKWQQMKGAWFVDQGGRKWSQSLYFPDDHPHHPGKCKGMQVILEERGLGKYKDLKSECEGFKCEDKSSMAICCMRRILFNQPDFSSIKSALEDALESENVEVLFLPKYHCELNPIEMVWGYAKRLYRLLPDSSKVTVLEENALNCLEQVPLLTMRRYVMISL
jgi:hypothetical protein